MLLHHLQSKGLIWFKEKSGYAPVRFFRNYSAFALVVCASLVVAGTNAHLRWSFSLFGGSLGEREAATLGNSRLWKSAQNARKDNLAFVALAPAQRSMDFQKVEEASVVEGTLLSQTEQMFLASSVGGSIARDPEEDGGVKIYTVQSGDTISGIASANGITVNTILWANDLDNVDSIRPGDQIFILPVAGFNYEVKTGDTIDSIASKYKAEKEQIIAFNGLPANGELVSGKTIVIPGGEKELPARASTPSSGLAPRQYATRGGFGTALDITPDFSRPKEGRAGTGHRFPYGYCTWYVAQKRYVPWGGNAGTWLYNARARGYKTGKAATPGSIVVTTENRYYGHVALVEKVSATHITVSEMNYTGWGKRSVRQLAKNSRVIKGYIY